MADDAAAQDYTVTISADDGVNSAVEETFTITVTGADPTSPTVTISGPTAPQRGTFNVRIAFSEPVTGFEQGDVTVDNGFVREFSGSGAGYRAKIRITPGFSGTVTVDVAANVAEDAAGNPNTAANRYSVEGDQTRPTVTISGPTALQNGPFDVTFAFTESMKGFEKGDVTVGNGSVTAFSGSGRSYTATIEPAGAGTVTVDVAAHVATDATGNPNMPAKRFSLEANTLPVITDPGDKSYEQGETITAFDITVTDADQDTVSVTVTGLPSGLSHTSAQVQGTVAADAAAQDYTVTIEADDGVNAAVTETFTITVTEPAAPAVTVTDASSDEGDSLIFTVTLDKAVSGGFTVTPSFTDGTAAEGTDYTGNTAALSFAGTKGEQHTFTVETTEDEVVEAGETFTVGLAVSGTTETVTASDTATGTISNDDGSATVSIGNASSTEGAAISFIVTVDKAVQGGFTVTPSFTDGTATEGTDYTENTAALTFSGAASEGQNLLVATTDDGDDEPDETFTVSLSISGTSLAVTAGGTATGTILDDDETAQPSLSNAPPVITAPGDKTYKQGEAITAFDITVTDADDDPVTVEFSGLPSGLSYTSGQVQGTVAGDVAAQDHTVTISADDGVNTAVTATFSITVTPELDRPKVTISGPSDTQGSSFEVTITFSESVTGFDPGDVTVGNGSVGTFVGTEASYTAEIVPAASGTVTVDVAANVSVDTEGNGNMPASRYSVEADRDPPTVTISGPSDAQNGVFEVTITFSEPVTGFDPGDVTVGNGSATAFSRSEASYTVEITPAATGTVTVDVAANVAVDHVGLGNHEPSRYSVEADLDAPTVSISGPTAAQEGVFNVTITFSESVTGFEKADVTVGSGAVTGFSGSETSYTARITPTVTGTVTVDVAADAAVDGAGNGNTAASQYSVQATALPNAPPAMAVPGEKTFAQGEAITAFDITATDFDGDAVTVTLSGLPSGLSYTNGQVQGTVAADATAQAYTVTVSADDGVNAAVTATFTIRVIETAPQGQNAPPVITAPDDKSYEQAESITAFGITVSDADQDTVTVTLSGLPSGLSYTNGQVQGTVADDAATQDYTVTISADDGVNTAVTATFTITVTPHWNRPTMDISGPTTAQKGAFDVRIVFSEVVYGFTKGDVTVGNGSVTSFSGSGDSYDATITPTASGTVTVDVAANVVKDGADLGNVAAHQYSVQADLDAPTVSISGPTASQSDSFDVTITFSESVTGFEKGDVTVGKGAVTALTGSGASYTATITPTASGTLTVDVAAGVATDGAGNGNTAASRFTVTAAPTPTVVISGPTDVQTGAFTITITFSEAVTGFEQSDVTVGNGKVTGWAETNGTASVIITPAATGTVTVDVAANVATNAAGNGNTAATRYSVRAIVPIEGHMFRISYQDVEEGSPLVVTATQIVDGTGFQLRFWTSAAQAETCCPAATWGVDPVLGFGDVEPITPPAWTASDQWAPPGAYANFSGKGDTQTISILTYEDDDVEHDEVFRAHFRAFLGRIVLSRNEGVITPRILNDDQATITVSDATVLEGGDLVFTATLNKALPSSVTVTPTFTAGTATGDDYTANTTPITFAGTAGEKKTFRVSTTDDSIAEEHETFTVGLTVSPNTPPWNYTGTGSAIAVVSGTGTIHDGWPAVTIEDVSAAEGESLTFTVTLDQAVPGGMWVSPSFTDVTATRDTDYTSGDTDTITFAGTAGETHTFTMTTTEDEVVELDETFTVSLTVSGTSKTVTATDTATGTITNDDTATVTVTDVSGAEGGPGRVIQGKLHSRVTGTARLDKAVQGGLRLFWETDAGGTATTSDFIANSLTSRTFDGTAGEEYTSFSGIEIIQDDVVEGTETIALTYYLFSVDPETNEKIPLLDGVTLDAPATATIIDDDTATVTITDASATEGDAITFTARLDKAVVGGFSVTPSFADGTATGGTDYTGNTAALTFAGTAGETQTFTVATTDDADVESNEAFTVSLSLSGTSLAVTVPGTATGTIIDDDGATAVTVNDASAGEGGSMTFTVTLNQAVSGGLTVTPSFTDVTATKNTDYTENTAGISFTGTAGETQTFTVATTEDTDAEPDETFTVSLSVTGTSATVTATDTATGTITDDDSAVVTISNASALEGDALTFTLTLDKAVPGGFTVQANSITPSAGSNATATLETDYTDSYITHGAWATAEFTGNAGEQHTVTFTTIEDTVVEGDEFFYVMPVYVPKGNTLLRLPPRVGGLATGTILDDDSAAVTVADASASEGESMTFTLTLDAAVQGGLTVTPGFTDGTAIKGTDYAENTAGITFVGNAGETQTFTVMTTEDTDKEQDESFTVTLSVSNAPSGVTATDTATGTITNDDGATAAVTMADASVDEGGALTFTVTLDAAVSGGLTVTPSFTDVTATEGTDYQENTAGLSFAGTAGETQTITVMTTEDADAEPDETFTVGLSVSGTQAPVTATDTATGTIINDDGALANVTIANSSADEGDSMTFAVTLDAAVSGGLTVTPSFTDITATKGTDYTENTTALTFAGTAGETQTFTVTTTEDAVAEPDETFEVSLALSGTQALVAATDRATGTITNDDGALANVTIADASAAEGDSLTFTVTLDAAVSGGLTVTPDFTDVTATKGTDYTENTAALTFAGTAGETQTFTVATTEDTDVEPSETFTVGLTVSETTDTVTATDTASGTVTDDDSSAVTIEDASAAEGDSLTFTVTLDNAVSGGLTVTPSFTDVTATEGTDYTENTAALTFAGNAGETKSFTVATTEDTAAELNETFTVSLVVSGTTAEVTATDTATGTITNDDGALAALTIEDASAEEGDSLTFTVTLDNAVSGGLTVTPSFTDVTATKGTDYTENSSALTFAGTEGEQKTFTVATIEDEDAEDAETFTVSLTVSGTSAEVTATDTATGTIHQTLIKSPLVEDDAAVTIGDASAEEGDSITFTVTLDKAVSGGLTVTPSFTDVTATKGTDYTENTSALTFAGTAGETKSFTVATTEDTDKEHHETFTVSLAVSGTSAEVTATDTATGTITNDDGALAEVTIEDVSAAEGDSLTFTVTLDNAVSGGLTVTPSFTDGTATEGTDYTENTAALSFTGTAGETQTFTVPTTEDATVEADETFTVGLAVSEATATVTASDTATGTITNDDGGATVTIEDASADEGETITFTVTLDKAVSGGLTVTPSFADVTATEGTDYTENTAALTFAGTTGEEQTFTVETTEDTDVEADETFTVSLTVSGTQAPVTASDTATGTITDDGRQKSGATPAVTVADASADEGDSITFTVTLNQAVSDGFTVTPGFTDVTATKGTDYTENTDALSFAGTTGETQTFTVATTQDTAAEGDETFTVSLTVSGTTETVTASDTATGTITDDDGESTNAPPVITAPDDRTYEQGETITPFGITVTDADGDSVTVTVTGLPSGLTFAPQVVLNSEGETNPSQVQGTVAANVAAQAYTVTVSADDGVNAAVTRTFTITVTEAAAQVTIADASAGEGDPITFTVTLNRAVSGGLTVTPSFTDGTAAKGADYTENTSALTFAGTAGETLTFTVETLEDEVVEHDETFTVSLTVSDAPPGVTAGDPAAGTITDDDGGAVDGSATVTIANASATEGDSMTFTVTLNRAVQDGLIVTPSFSDGTAAKGTDYTENTAALSFAGTAGETQTFTVETIEDEELEDDETFTVSLSVSDAPPGVTVGDPAAGTITDDDGGAAGGSGAVTIANASATEGDSMTFTVTLHRAVQGGLTVTPGFSDVTATANRDYTPNTAALSFTGTAGERQAFRVETIEDAVPEGNETFRVSLSVSDAPSGVTAGGPATGTIEDDDSVVGASAAVTIANASATEGDSMAFTVTLHRAVPGGLTVTPRFTDVTAAANSDYTPNTAALSFTGTAGERRTFTVETIEDTVGEGNETFTVSLDLSGAPAELTAGDPATGTITDDDGGSVGVNNAPNAEDDYITVSQGDTATTLANGNSAAHLKNQGVDPFGPSEDLLDDLDGSGDERSYLAILLETSVLANDSDSEDDITRLSVELVDGVSHGDLTLNRDGTFAYAHDGSEVAEDRFTYRVKDSDGALSEIAEVTITILEVTSGPANAGPKAETIPDQILLFGKEGKVELVELLHRPRRRPAELPGAGIGWGRHSEGQRVVQRGDPHPGGGEGHPGHGNGARSRRIERRAILRSDGRERFRQKQPLAGVFAGGFRPDGGQPGGGRDRRPLRGPIAGAGGERWRTEARLRVSIR